MIRFLSFPSRGWLIVAFWGIAIFVYFLMVFGTLADIQRIASAKPFDMRPFGYSYEQALTLLSSLGEEGRRIYLTRQIPLDTFYPALLAISSSSSLIWLSRAFGSTARLYHAAAVLAYMAAIADYAENGLIVWMLKSGPSVPEGLVVAASLASVSKSLLTTIVFLSLLAALVERAFRTLF